jgi:hypothetical protein
VNSECRITPVRSGAEATWDVTVYVPPDRARETLDAIAAALPADYRAETAGNETSNRIGLHADAGDFVAIDADARAADQGLTLTASTGCRPADSHVARTGPGEHAPGDPQSRDLPAAFTAPVRALRLIRYRYEIGPPVACPDGGARRMYTTVNASAPKDLGRSLQGVVAGATVVRADPTVWAYRSGSDSVVITAADAQVTIKVTTGCR